MFASKSEFVGAPRNSINVTEGGIHVGERWVWTGPLKGGAPSTRNCESWTSKDEQATVGSAQDPRLWTGTEGDADYPYWGCGDYAQLYCFEK